MDDSFPKTLKEFGYGFNDEGQLRIIDQDTGSAGELPFEFEVDKDNYDYNQRRYEALGEIIDQQVYELLETKGKLKKLFLTKRDSPRYNEMESFIYVSDDVFTNSKKLLVLVHGSGVVKAGQWARRLIINDKLDTGTQLPFIEMAKQKGFAVIVTNTNDNYRMIGKKKKLIQGSENPVNHLLSVWNQVIDKSPAKDIAFVAHSYGGVCVLELASQVENKFQDRVFALAMTDSVHSMVHHDTIKPSLQQCLCQVTLKERKETPGSAVMRVAKAELGTRIKNSWENLNYTDSTLIGRNWVSSGLPLDTAIGGPPNDIDRVSAGHTQHEMTSYCSMSSIFKFLDDKLQRKQQPT